MYYCSHCGKKARTKEAQTDEGYMQLCKLCYSIYFGGKGP